MRRGPISRVKPFSGMNATALMSEMEKHSPTVSTAGREVRHPEQPLVATTTRLPFADPLDDSGDNWDEAEPQVVEWAAMR